MSSSDLIRWGGLAAMAGGVVWVVDSALPLLTLSESGVTDVLFIIAALCTIEGFAGFHALQKDDYGRIGRSGFWTVVVATLALVIGLVVSLLGSTALLEKLELFPVGTFAVFVGFVLYGVATLQARVLPRWCGMGLIVGPFMFLLGNVGGIVFGILCLVLGYTLWSRGNKSVGQPSRIS